ncbi:MAG: hypothetical protein WBQ71_22945 [Trebonia sp.]
MAAATRPAANATVASAVARIIAGIAATRRTARRPGTRIGEDPPRPCVSYPVTRISRTAAGQDEDRARDRHQRPWHGPGHVPRLSQPSQPAHRAKRFCA